MASVGILPNGDTERTRVTMTPAVADATGKNPGPFRVLMVCSANQCRSPMAAFLLHHAVDQLELDWIIDSAGTNVRAGTSIHPLVRDVLAEKGMEIGSHRARQLTADNIAAADLILTADTMQRQYVVSAHIRALSKTYSLRQFARFASAVELESDDRKTLGADLTLGAHLARTRFQPAVPGGDDIPDPIGGKIRHFRACRDLVSSAVDQIVAPLASSPAIGSAVAAVPEPSDDAFTAPSPAWGRRLIQRALLPRRP